MTYSINQLDAAIENDETEWEGSWFEFEDQSSNNYRYVNGDYVSGAETGVEIPGIGWAENVHQHGGEGQGDHLEQTFSVIGPDGEKRYFTRVGWYQSYNGGDYDGPTYEVHPVEKTVTVYERLK